MTVNAKTILVHTIYIMVFAHIDTVSIMICITAPHKVMPPQILIACKEVSKKGITAKNSGREVQTTLSQITWHYGTGIFIHIFLDKIPLGIKGLVNEILLQIPILIIQARLRHVRIYTKLITEKP
jgi:hypothetical protein